MSKFPQHSSSLNFKDNFITAIYEDHKIVGLYHSNGKVIQLDAYIPELHLGVEYQGEQHYKNIYRFNMLHVQQQKDKEKFKKCKEVNKF